MVLRLAQQFDLERDALRGLADAPGLVIAQLGDEVGR
jgi:hypothetical protein